MKWRKWFVIPLALILCVGMLAGCGDAKESSGDKDVEIEEVVEKSEPASEEKSEKAEEEDKSEAEAEEKEPEETKAPEEDVTPASLLENHRETLKDLKSIAFNMVLDMEMDMEAMGETMSQKMNMDVQFESDMENSYMVGTMEADMDGEKETDDVEQYIMKEGDKLVSYSYDKATGSWEKGGDAEITLSAEMIPDIDISGFDMEETDDQYICTGTIEMKELIESSGEALSSMFDEFVGGVGTEFTGDVGIEYIFDKETKTLAEANIDMAAVLEETFNALFSSLLSSADLGEDVDLSSAFEIKVGNFALKFSDIRVNEDIEIALPDEAQKAEDDTDADDTKSAGGSALSFETFTPIDNNECVVTVKELDPDGDYGYTVKIGLENKSADKTYEYMVESCYVNGLEASAYLFADVAPGKKANEEIELDSDQLAEYGIDEITDIEILFQVIDADDWGSDPAAEETFHIYPYGEAKATTYTREAQAEDNILIDNETATVIVTGTEQDDIWGYSVNLYVENKTDKQLMIQMDNGSVNGYMMDAFFAKIVPPGKCAYGRASWSNEDLEKNEITDVEEIEFELTARDYEDYSADELIKETFTIKP